MADNPETPSISTVRWQGLVAIVEVIGEIDLARSTAFQQELMDLLDSRPERVVIDLSEVPHMDSSGIASLVKLLSRTRKTSVELRLAGLTQRVQSLFEITRLDKVFEIRPSVQEALA